MNKYKHAMEVIKALQEDPKRVQMLPECSGGAEWCDADCHNTEPATLSELDNPSFWRIKPTPTKVPFGPEDITSDMWFRFRNDLEWHRVSAFGHSQVRLSNGAKLSYSDLARSLTYRRDGWPMERDEKCEKPSTPEPKREPRRVWVNYYMGAEQIAIVHLSKEGAEAEATDEACESAVEFVEVIR